MQPWLITYQQQLSQQIIAGKLPHALLLQGVPGAGKSELANWLVNVLSCQHLQMSTQQTLQACGQCKHCLLQAKQSFPDHLTVISEKNSIGVDDIRQVSSFLQKTAQMSGYQSVVVPFAETMTEAAANALLKTLEEPTAKTLLILTSSDCERLLPTIISRCRIIAIRPYVGDELLAHLGLPSDLSDDSYLNLTQLPELMDSEVKAAQQAFIDLCLRFLVGQNVCSQLTKLLLENEHALRWFEQFWINLYRQSFQWPIKNYPVLAELNQDKVYWCYQTFLAMQKRLLNFQQANKTLLIEKMLIEMSACLPSR